MSKVNELKTVVLTNKLATHNLKAGDVGTVVHDYKKKNTLEVEFTSASGKKGITVTLHKNDLRPAKNDEILHVRSIGKHKARIAL